MPTTSTIPYQIRIERGANVVAFEKYHPLLSAHYTFDWLTASKLKELHALRADATQATLSDRTTDAAFTQTARYVNHAMRLVMANQALIYGVTDRQTQALVASVALLAIDPQLTQAQLQVESTLGDDSVALYDEIIPRIVGFGFFELGLATLTASLPQVATPLGTWLLAHHFEPTASPQLGRQFLTLAKSAVADNPQYHF
ncbi:GNAT family N-acetyltransferase [Lacticaseibacillus sp. GG6-2]